METFLDQENENNFANKKKRKQFYEQENENNALKKKEKTLVFKAYLQTSNDTLWSSFVLGRQNLISQKQQQQNASFFLFSKSYPKSKSWSKIKKKTKQQLNKIIYSTPPLYSLFNQQWTKKRVCSFQALNCANCFGGVELHLHFDYLLLVHQHDIY